MNFKKVLRLLIITQMVFHTLSMISFYLYNSYSINEEAAELIGKSASLGLAVDLILLASHFLGVVLLLLGAVGVFFLYSWGRKIYLLSAAMDVVFGAFMRPFITTGITLQLEFLAVMACGAIIFLLLTHPDEFTRRPFRK